MMLKPMKNLELYYPCDDPVLNKNTTNYCNGPNKMGPLRNLGGKID